MKIKTEGRTDVNDYFAYIESYKKLAHTPVLAFVDRGDSVAVQIIDKPKDILSYDIGTKMMGQWAGEWRSDYFQFTAGQYIEFCNNKEQDKWKR